MGGLWNFLLSKDNREILAWLGGGAVVIVAGLWTAFVYFHPPKGGDSGGATQLNANCGSVAIGGSASGATINAGGANANCAAKPN